MKNEFVRVRSIKDICISLALISIGLLCMLLFESQAVTVFGFFLLLAGLFLIFIMKTGYKDVSTGINYTKTEHYFAQSFKDEIIRQLNCNPTTLSFKDEDQGTGLRLDIYTNKNGVTYYQLFEYIPYKYEPCTKIYKTEL